MKTSSIIREISEKIRLCYEKRQYFLEYDAINSFKKSSLNEKKWLKFAIDGGDLKSDHTDCSSV